MWFSPTPESSPTARASELHPRHSTAASESAPLWARDDVLWLWVHVCAQMHSCRLPIAEEGLKKATQGNQSG